MSKFINGSIVSIDEEIVSDIERLVTVAENYCHLMDTKVPGEAVKDVRAVKVAASRVRDYIETYKSTEEDVI